MKLTNYIERLSPRSIRAVFTVISVFALLLCLHNFMRFMIFEATGNDQCAWRVMPQTQTKLLITDVVKGGVADVAGIKDGDTLLAINGRHFTSTQVAQPIINAVPAGQYASYTISRNGQVMELKVQILKLFDIRSLSLWLLGFGFLLVGYVVVMTRPTGKIQRLFGWYGITAMLFFGLITSNVNGAVMGRIPALIYISALVVTRLFGPFIFLIFFYYFPVRHPVLDRRWLRPLLLCLGLASTSVIVLQPLVKLDQVVVQLVFSFPLFCFITGLFVFAINYFKRVDPARRGQLRPIFITAAVDVAVFTYAFVVLYVNPFLFLLNPVAILPLFLVVLLPLGFGYSIFRYRLMDIDFIIKRSLIYGAITATIAAVYLLVVVGVGQLVAAFFGQANSQTLNILAFVVIAFIFDPVKRWAQGLIDRSFYQERYFYQQALLEFSRELPRKMNMEEILQSMIRTIAGAMHVDRVGVVVCDESEGCLTLSSNIPKQYEHFENRAGGLIALLRTTLKPLPLGLIGEESDVTPIDAADKQRILASGIVLSVPMFLKDKLIGTINVGPKLSGKVYSQEDTDLLSTVASQAAIAIENARLHRSEVDKERMEEELSIARKIQQGLLPKSNPVIPGLEVAGVSIPALSVGGDYYDYIRLKDGRFLVVVADVSGKGMSAALYMSKIQGMVQLAAHMYSSPKEMLIEVNRRIYDGIERKSFITMILGMFDVKRGEVIICRAGHNKALVGTNGDLRFAEAAGIGLGLEPGPLFERELEEVRQPLEPGKLFVFYSDGLTEAMNEKEDQFGEDAVYELVKSNRALPAGAMQQRILSQVEQFRGTAPVHDDITLVIVKSSAKAD